MFSTSAYLMEADALPPLWVTLLFFKMSNVVSPSCLDERLMSVFKDLLSYSQSRPIYWKIDLTSWGKKKKNQTTTKKKTNPKPPNKASIAIVRWFITVWPAAPVLHKQSHLRLEVGRGVTWKNPSSFLSSMALCPHQLIRAALDSSSSSRCTVTQRQTVFFSTWSL